MTHKKMLKILTVSILTSMLTACWDNWLAGGASIEGTGGIGQPKPPNHTGDDDGDKVPFLTLAKPVIDQCQDLQRELRFLDNLTGEVFDELTEVPLYHQVSPQGSIHLQLVVTNTGASPIIETQPACYVPVSLYVNEAEQRSFPANACSTTQQIRYEPQQSRTFDIHHLFETSVVAVWKYGEESQYRHEGRDSFNCEPLTISFGIYEKDVEENVDGGILPP